MKGLTGQNRRPQGVWADFFKVHQITCVGRLAIKEIGRWPDAYGSSPFTTMTGTMDRDLTVFHKSGLCKFLDIRIDGYKMRRGNVRNKQWHDKTRYNAQTMQIIAKIWLNFS